MATTPDEVFQLAEKLYGDEPVRSEALCRAVVSRAYYAAFSQAQKVTPQTGGADIHRRTVEALKASAQHLTSGNRLDTLRMLRTNADYRLSIAFSQQTAGEALKTARRLLRDLDPTRPPSP